MRFLENTSFPDFSYLQERLCEILLPISASLRIQYPQLDFDIASKSPTVTVSIKDIKVYDRFLGNDAPLVSVANLAIGIYIPKLSDSAYAYRLFSEIANLLFESDLGVERVSCDSLEYLPDLRHYCLKGEAILKPQNIKEEQDGDTNV